MIKKKQQSLTIGKKGGGKTDDSWEEKSRIFTERFNRLTNTEAKEQPKVIHPKSSTAIKKLYFFFFKETALFIHSVFIERN